ncbi:MAG: hypothetical protein ACOC00_00010 [Halothiobacillaceae bacterium]
MSRKLTRAARDAKRIRATLRRAYGWTSSQVSVRCNNYSMGSSIQIIIHDPAVDMREVQNVAASAEHIRRCDLTGEILCGGNQHLSVEWSRGAMAMVCESHADIIRSIADASGTVPPGRGVTVGHTIVWNEGYMITLSDEADKSDRAWINPDAPATIAHALLMLGLTGRKS